MSENKLIKPINRLKDAINIATEARNKYGEKSELWGKWNDIILEYEYAIAILEGAKNINAAVILVDSVRKWATERCIIGENAGSKPEHQFKKLEEEFEELREGLSKEDQHEVIDAIGDCTVCLINLAELIGCPFEKCLAAAYNEIKDRKGKMIDGMFVKEADLNSTN